MAFAAILGACLVAGVILWLGLARWRAAAAWALPLTALAYGGAVLAYGQWLQDPERALRTVQPERRVYFDIYYIVQSGAALKGFAVGFVGLAVVTALGIRLCRTGEWRALTWLFWACAAGALSLMLLDLQASLLMPMPRRYVDYPDWTAALQLVSRGATALCCIAALGMAALLARALLRRLVG